LQSETQYLQAGVQLMLALGGGWSEQDLPKMNGIGLYHETIAQ
jgi:outer membrane protein TolC